MAGFSFICCVVNSGSADKVMECAKKYGVKGGTISIGRGTVHSRLLELLGLNEVRKEVITMIVENELAHRVMKGISTDMMFHKAHHGIAFSVSVSEFIGSRNQIGDNPETNEVKSNMYNAIYAVVDRGSAEDVIEAANQAGARGATIINARGTGVHEVKTLFHMQISPEKEEVFIITTRELKDGIVAAIKARLKIDEPGNGILFVVDVNEAYGLHES
ncbi:MAG: P-II family nitrogen regulator [Oscillospiraceae bacterium]|nr:P-II family nitrogen regulator [Oscillospiraceae bacterium]